MGLLGSAVQCQDSWYRHSARSGHAQHPLVVRRQQGQQLLEIFRMSVGVLHLVIGLELGFEGLLETGGSLEQLVQWGRVGPL